MKINRVGRRFCASLLVVCGTALALVGCGGGSSSGGSSPSGSSAPSGSGSPSGATQTYALSGTVSGLNSSGLVLTAAGANVSVANGATTVALASGLATAATYAVTVQTQPTGETCSVAAGSGTIGSANVANVVVTCSDQSFALGGSIAGLNGSGVVLTDGTESLTVTAGATTFSMPMPVAYTSSYSVNVKTQPAGQACSVTNGSGTMPAAAVTSIAVSCTDQPFTVGGTISGLGTNTGLVLNNGSDTVAVAAGATTFALPTAVKFGSTYNVIASSTPAGLSCTVMNGQATMGASNVTNVSVTCADKAFTLGGTISGLTSVGLVVGNGTANTFSVPSGSTTFTLPAQVAFSSTYSVTVRTQPTAETCTVSAGNGTMPASAVATVALTCSVNAYTVGGTISGLARSGLTLLNNGGDSTSIATNATQYTMNTSVAYGAPYDVTVGTQPYGIDLACTPAANTGTVNGTVTTANLACATVTPVQKAIERHLSVARGVAVDSSGNVFVVDSNMVKEFPFSNGSYGEPVMIGSGFATLSGIAVDTSANLYVTDTGNRTVNKMPFGNGAYGTPVTLDSGFTDPSGVAVDAAGNVYVADAGRLPISHVPGIPGSVTKIPYSSGSYGAPVSVGSGFTQSTGVAVDAAGNVYVAEAGNSSTPPGANGDLIEVPYSNGSYGAPVSIGSGFSHPTGVAVDAAGNVYVTDGAVEEIPAGGGAVQTLGSGFSSPFGVAVDATGNVYVSDNIALKKIPAGNGAVQTLCPAYLGPYGVAVDGSGDVYLAANDSNLVVELPYSNGMYGAPVSIGLGSGFIGPFGVAVDASGNVYVGAYDSGINSSAVRKIPAGGGPVQTVASGFSGGNYIGVAVDAAGNVYVADGGNNAVKEIPYNNGTYGTPVSIGSGFNYPNGVAVDAAGNVYVADSYNDAVKKIPAGGGAIQTLYSGTVPWGVAVDATGNVFFTDPGGSTVEEIPYSSGTYGAAVTLGSGFSVIAGVAVDINGRVYVANGDATWVFLPQ